MTGTRLDLLPWLISPLRWLTLFLLLGLTALLFWGAWRLWRRWPWYGRVVIVAVPMYLLGWLLIERHENQLARQARLQRYEQAKAHFEAQCQKAGLQINKTVSGVKGLVFMRWRTGDFNHGNLPGDQFRMNDPYGGNCRGEDCLYRMLRVTRGQDLDPDQSLAKTLGWANPYIGYDYLETTDPADGKKYRYIKILAEKPGHLLRPSLTRQIIPRYTARYGITWEDLSTLQDREQWIAGSSLKIIDLKTQDVLAERTAYMFDRGMGINGPMRAPWSTAEKGACGRMAVPEDPNDHEVSSTEMRDFAMKVLLP